MAEHNRHPMVGAPGNVHKPGTNTGMQQLQGQGQTYTFQGQHPQAVNMQQSQVMRNQPNTVYSTSIPNVRGGNKPDLQGSQVYGQQGTQIRASQRYYPVQQSMPPPFASPPRKGADRIRPAANHQKKQCNCKNSRCLKLYCECFASGRYCDSCNCVNCFNNRENEEIRHSAVEAILERNPNAFRPKIQGTEHESSAQQLRGAAADGAVPRHTKGCNCKKSTCLKKYCECFQASIYCSDNCKCIDCKNFEGSEARSLVLAAQETAANSLLLTSPMKRSRLSAAAQQPQQIGMSSALHLPTSHHAPSQLSVMQVVQPPMAHALPQRPSIPPMHGLQHIAHASPQHQAIHPTTVPAPRPPAAASTTVPAAIPNPRLGMQEVVSEVVKPEVIHELCRLLILVADDEAVKVRAAAEQVMAADGTSSAAGAANAVELTRRSIEAQERVVMEEFLSVLQKILDTSNKKAGPDQPQLPQPQPSIQAIQPAGVSAGPLHQHLSASKPSYLPAAPFSPNAQSFGSYQLAPASLLPARDALSLSQPTLPDSKSSFPNPFHGVSSLPAPVSAKAPPPPASLLPGALSQLAAHIEQLQSFAGSTDTAQALLHLPAGVKTPPPALSMPESSQSLPIDQLSIPYSLPEQTQKQAVQMQQQQQQELATLLSRVANQVSGGDAAAAAAVAAAAAAVAQAQTSAADGEGAMQLDAPNPNGVAEQQQQPPPTEEDKPAA